jgi:hypothetical protein
LYYALNHDSVVWATEWFLYPFARPDNIPTTISKSAAKNIEIALFYCCFIYVVPGNTVCISLHALDCM